MNGSYIVSIVSFTQQKAKAIIIAKLFPISLLRRLSHIRDTNIVERSDNILLREMFTIFSPELDNLSYYDIKLENTQSTHTK
mmetsp:Transcript_22731/g.26195  ORF Transcript_22731/g.26195 Transcript_22731/m.26195 type:complete len:82 (-) Transcript_22731:102-347(-)